MNSNKESDKIIKEKHANQLLYDLLSEKVRYAECPVKKTAEIIEGKWTTRVVRELLDGKKRYSEIQRAINGISPKILSARLKMLEKRKLVRRTVYATVPPTTEYELTKTGKKLEPVLAAMAQFGAELTTILTKA